MKAEIKSPEEKLDPNNQNYVHNFFISNADIWTDRHDWVMSLERFKQCISQFTPVIGESGEEEKIQKAIEFCDEQIKCRHVYRGSVSLEYKKMKSFLKELK